MTGESRKMTFHIVLRLDGMEHVRYSAGGYFSFLLVDDDTGLEILHVHVMTVLDCHRAFEGALDGHRASSFLQPSQHQLPQASAGSRSVHLERDTSPWRNIVETSSMSAHANFINELDQARPRRSAPKLSWRRFDKGKGLHRSFSSSCRMGRLSYVFTVPTTYQGWNDRAIEPDARYWQNWIVTQLSTMGVVEWEPLGKDQLLIGKSRLTDGWFLQRRADGASTLPAENMVT
ncbi:hypothetical protein ARMSODRAFT_973551 [Armillaria solidipes]|uniref:Uncharacterized protein n=1 Tax=Armillaria solidipes TaxID=1076256 RepID=A0A2H3BJM8_9AGAR|nr:hypothetical protein ARMSODRAFT_973551 [Armillaria solidipes]